MDAYFPKTRRPSNALSSVSAIKRPPPATTPPRPAKIPATPTTPRDARLNRPLRPPPVKSKREQLLEKLNQSHQEKVVNQRHLPIPASPIKTPIKDALTTNRKKPMSIRELFKKNEENLMKQKNDEQAPLAQVLVKTTTTPTIAPSPSVNDRLNPITTTPLAKPLPASPCKISKGPLKGVSSSLLDLIRAKEAAANSITPEEKRERELLGLAPEVVRIVLTVFTANDKEVLPYDKVAEKCFKGLKSNYSLDTITSCLNLLDVVVPEWVTTIRITRGRFMRLNRDKYTLLELLEAIRRYRSQKHPNQKFDTSKPR